VLERSGILGHPGGAAVPIPACCRDWQPREKLEP
jgi:hypothetical protein